MADAASTEVKPGDDVSWQWSSGRPSGTVSDVNASGPVTMTTARGNEVKRDGEPENPAVKLDRGSGHDVVKKASEVDIEVPAEEKKDGEKDGGLKVPDAGAKRGKSKSPAPSAGRGKSRSKSPNPTATATNADKKDDKKSEEPAKLAEAPAKAGGANGTAAAEKKKKAEPAKKAEKKAADADVPKKKSGRPKGAGAAGGPKKDKPKKRAATETGEPRRSKRNKTS